MRHLAQSQTIDATVIVPAHNEGRGIRASLNALAKAIDILKARDGLCKVGLIVACNGCSDDTAAIAARAFPAARVIETPERGKAGAINLALDAAPPGPAIILDADVAVDAATLAAMLSALGEPGVLAASPAASFALAGVSPPVRAYFRIFARHPYLTRGVGGSGIYGLSAVGRQQLGKFPPIAADDQYVRHLFPLAGQRRIARDGAGRPISVTVRPPRTLADLLRVEIRARNGDRVVRSMCPNAGDPADPWMWPAFRAAPRDFAVFVAIKVLARLLLPLSPSGRGDGWATARR